MVSNEVLFLRWSSFKGTSGALAIIAGADTTSSAMSSLLYFLMRDYERMRRLQEEVDHVYPDTDHVLDSSKHSELKYLNACM